MEIAVTGSTGFVGRSVIDALVAEGYRPRRLIRHASRPNPGRSPASDPAGTHGEVRHVDFSDTADLASACQGAEAVIHLVGIISERGDETYEQVHAGQTARMIAATRDAGVRRFLHMSALGTRSDARARYHRSKWDAEQSVRASGLGWTIFRPSLIYGPGDSFTRLFSRMSDFSPVLPAIGGGHSLMQPVAVKQVAQAFVRALRLPESIGETYDLCGPERLAFRDILSVILAARRRHRFILTVPFPVARWQARILEWIWPRLLHRAPPLNRDQILMLEEDNVGDAARADALFGLIHEPLQVALDRQFGRNDSKPGTGSPGILPTSNRGR